MKIKLLSLFLSLIASLLFTARGQTSYETIYRFIDRDSSNKVVESESKTETEVQNGITQIIKETYFVQGKEISKYRYLQNQKAFDKFSDRSGTPYRLITFDLDSVKISDYIMIGSCRCGFYYLFYPNGKLKISGEYHELTDEELQVKNQKKGDCNPAKNGTWTYYDSNGNKIKTEQYVNGELIE
jgi:hypothetical protein